MRTIHFSMLTALGVTLTVGCGAPSGDTTNDGVLQNEEAIQTQDGGGVGGATAPSLDARAAAASVGGSGAGTSSSLAAWYTGPLAAGAQQTWHWSNAGNYAYKVGLAPSGARTTCQIQIVRSWDVRRSSGEREFYFTLQNTGATTCGANVLLQSQAAANTWSTGTIAPGASANLTWNNATPLTASHFANVLPSVGTTPCELEVTRSWYVQLPSGGREFRFSVKNVGSSACGGTALLATNTNIGASWSTGTIAPGASVSMTWNNANPLNRVYVPGVSPLGATGSTACQLELLPASYQQVLNANRTNERRYRVDVRNVGTISCSGTLLLNHLDPSNTNPLPVNLYPQQTINWCWAASAEMVMSFAGGMVSQCEQANQRFGRTDCCNTPTPQACVGRGWPEFQKYGFSFNTSGALSWNDLMAQVNARRPFAFSWWWDGGGGHMMVVIGYKVINGQNWVTIHDPWSPDVGDQRDILYSDYVDGTGYSHATDYYNVVRN